MAKKRKKRREDISWKAIRFVGSKRDDGFAGLNSPVVAEAVGITPPSLSRAFRREHKMKFCEYLRRTKLWMFDDMLKKEPDTPMKELIARTEYESHKYFKKQFKKLYGMTPSERRKYHKMKGRKK